MRANDSSVRRAQKAESVRLRGLEKDEDALIKK